MKFGLRTSNTLHSGDSQAMHATQRSQAGIYGKMAKIQSQEYILHKVIDQYIVPLSYSCFVLTPPTVTRTGSPGLFWQKIQEPLTSSLGSKGLT